MKLVTAEKLEECGLLKQSTAYYLAHRGEIPHLRFGKRAIRFDIDEVKAFLKDKMSQSVKQVGE